ncbi:BSD domain-containing protein [Phthorimaea operculella]|nr:BSD domain-containing protein [Phthorimaea operculella]
MLCRTMSFGRETGGEPVISPSSAAKRLDSSPLLKEQYNRLVPDAVSHDEFWERYLFRVALLQDRLAAASRKQPADVTEDPVLAHLPLQSVDCTPQESPKKQPSLPSVVPSVVDCDSPYETPDIETVAWEDEDFANDVELTEEQQILLLEEYEREIASKKQLTKQTSSRDIANNNTEDKTTNTTATKKKTINTKTTVAKTSTAATKSSTVTTKSSVGNARNVKTSPNKTPVKTAEVNKTNTTGKSRDKMNNKTVKEAAKKSPMKGKTDDCGNNIVEDYFGDNQRTQRDEVTCSTPDTMRRKATSIRSSGSSRADLEVERCRKEYEAVVKLTQLESIIEQAKAQKRVLEKKLAHEMACMAAEKEAAEEKSVRSVQISRTEVG